MTTQSPVQPNPASHSTPALDTATFPPNLSDTVQLEFRKLLHRDHPNVVIDFNNTWLTQYDYKARHVPPFTDFPSRRGSPTPRWDRRFNQSYSLCESLVDFFLGALTLEEDTVGWFTVADSVAVTHRIISLSHKQFVAIYHQLGDSLAESYKQALAGYWSSVETDGKSRQSLFMGERVKALQLEARADTDQKTLTSQQGAMLQEILRYSSVGSPNAIKKHGIFSLELLHGENQSLPFAGTFVITHANQFYPLEVEHGRLGAVVLYSPNDGLEGFDSVQLLSDALTQRMNDPAQKSWLLKNAPQDLASEVLAPNVGHPLIYSWHFRPLQGHFLGAQFLLQIAKQQSDFLHCVKTSKTQGLKYRAFIEQLSLSLDPRYQFDNFLNLDWNDRYVLYTSMPNWWRAMSVANKDSWLISAKSIGNSIIDLKKLTHDYLNNPLTQDRPIADDFINTVMEKALKEKNIMLSADDIYVDVVYTPALLPPYLPHLAVPADPGLNISKRYSLRSLAAEKPGTLKLGTAHSVTVTGKNGEAVKDLTDAFVRDLIERLGNKATINTFLNVRLKTSTYAKSLVELATRLTRMQMRMGLLNAKAYNIPEPCLEWIAAVIDAPGASSDRIVDHQKIVLRFLAINNVALSNVAKISPQDGSPHGLVLCTLNAPDGVIFRWFADITSAKINFLDNPTFAHYLMHQIPLANRTLAAQSLLLDQPLKHFRFPDFFRNFPSPIPLPSLLWETISFVEQTHDFFAENHGLKIDHLLADSTANLLSAREINTEQTYAAMHLSVGIFLLFLPPPVSIPIALGLGLYKAWNGFRAIEDNDHAGAAKEFLLALEYLATAKIAKLALASRSPTPLNVFRRHPRPIARRVGADGDPHIGLVLQPSTPGSSATGEINVIYDAQTFHPIGIEDQVFYVRPRANLFGHKKLFSRTPDSPEMLKELDEFALFNNEGQWLKAPYQASGISAKTYRQANEELGKLISGWPATVEELTPLQRIRFEEEYILLSKSNTHLYPEVEAYCEGGSALINQALRTGRSSEEANAFMEEFYRLDEFNGQAFRAAYVSRSGLERLRGKSGTIFADKGIQSASVNEVNASRWSTDDFVTELAGPDDHPIFLIFDSSIPKKNMFTAFLGDHVGIAPETPLQLMAFRNVKNVNYAFFSAPEQIPQFYIDTYSGAKVAFI